MENKQDFNAMAKARFDELEAKEKQLKAEMESIQKQKAPLKALLQGAGIIEVKRRGRRKKVVAE
jgi:hypothetical protein